MMAANKDHVDAAPPAYTPAPTHPSSGYGYDQPGDFNQPGFNPSVRNPYMHGQTTVVVAQPTNSVIVQQPHIPDHYGLAIFACLCCCWPIGIAAIIKASEVQDHVARGDIEAAMNASKSAATLSKVAIGCGIIIMVIAIIVGVVMTMGAASSGDYHGY